MVVVRPLSAARASGEMLIVHFLLHLLLDLALALIVVVGRLRVLVVVTRRRLQGGTLR